MAAIEKNSERWELSVRRNDSKYPSASGANKRLVAVQPKYLILAALPIHNTLATFSKHCAAPCRD